MLSFVFSTIGRNFVSDLCVKYTLNSFDFFTPCQHLTRWNLYLIKKRNYFSYLKMYFKQVSITQEYILQSVDLLHQIHTQENCPQFAWRTASIKSFKSSLTFFNSIVNNLNFLLSVLFACTIPISATNLFIYFSLHFFSEFPFNSNLLIS